MVSSHRCMWKHTKTLKCFNKSCKWFSDSMFVRGFCLTGDQWRIKVKKHQQSTMHIFCLKTRKRFVEFTSDFLPNRWATRSIARCLFTQSLVRLKVLCERWLNQMKNATNDPLHPWIGPSIPNYRCVSALLDLRLVGSPCSWPYLSTIPVVRNKSPGSGGVPPGPSWATAAASAQADHPDSRIHSSPPHSFTSANTYSLLESSPRAEAASEITEAAVASFWTLIGSRKKQCSQLPFTRLPIFSFWGWDSELLQYIYTVKNKRE